MPSDPYDERDADSQRFTKSYLDQDFLEAIDQIAETGELATTTTIAETVGCNRRTAHHRLTALEESGRVESKDAGRVLVWNRVEE